MVAITQDALLDILSLLPVKSILRFKAVSKKWAQLTSTRNFIATHLRRSSPNPSLLLRLCHTLSGNEDIALFTNPTGDFDTRYLAVPLKKSPVKFPSIVGSVNGLVCLDVSPSHHGSDFVLWNPVTSQSRHLPSPSIACTKGKPFWITLTGFGYESSNNDYKIVRIVTYSGYDFENLAIDVSVEVYSCKEDSWKEIKDCSVFELAVILADQDGVFVEHSLNWVGIGKPKGSSSYRKVVVSFDMRNEVFEVIELEPSVTRLRDVRMMSYMGLLAIAIYPVGFALAGYHTNRFEFWVRDVSVDNGTRTWIHVGLDEEFSVSWVPMVTWRDDKLVMKHVGDNENDRHLLLYDPVDKQTGRLPIYIVGFNVQCCSHVESLVSV